MRRWRWRRENNKIVDEGIKTLRRENSKIVKEEEKGNLFAKGWLAFFDYFNRIFNLIFFLQLF